MVSCRCRRRSDDRRDNFHEVRSTYGGWESQPSRTPKVTLLLGWMPVTFRVVSLPISHWAGSMQSSFTLLCRVLVMLTCLVVLPLAALTGGTGRKMIVPLVEKCLNLLREPPVESDGRPSGPRPLLRSSAAASRPGAANQQVATGTYGSGPTSGSGRAVYPDRGALNQPQEQLGPPPSASDLQPLRQGLPGRY